MTLVAVIAAFAVALAFAAAFLALTLNSGRTTDVARLAAQIQNERAENVLRNCLDVNDRHDATIRQLDLLLTVRLRSTPPALRDQMRQNTAAFVLIVEAIVPKRDCRRVVRQQVRSK